MPLGVEQDHLVAGAGLGVAGGVVAAFQLGLGVGVQGHLQRRRRHDRPLRRVVAVWVRGQGARWRLEGSWSDLAAANLFLAHLRVRSFAPATVRAYAYDVLCFGRFCIERDPPCQPLVRRLPCWNR